MEVKKVINGKEEVIIIKVPSANDYTLAKSYSNKVAARLLNDKDERGNPTVLLRSQISEIREKLGIWSKKHEEQLNDLDDLIVKKVRQLSNGGKMTLKAASNIAFDIRKLRKEKFELLSKSRELDERTLESEIENSNFNFLAMRCLVNEEGEQLFNSVDEYVEASQSRVNEGMATLIVEGVSKLAGQLYGLDENFEKSLPENKFLKKYNLVDENLHFVKNGRLVSEDGILVNSDNRYIDEEGNLIDRSGNRVDVDGNLIGNETEIVDFVEDTKE